MNKLIDIFILVWAITFAVLILGVTANAINITTAKDESFQEDVKYKKEKRIRYHVESGMYFCEDMGKDFMILDNKVTCID